ncbi:hypothetical protein [Phreatobacter sp.]|uniref:hypothetical protein n=1 Tax=Phreatobacter sp. TaxID=1966341 RepID=UPI003F6F92BF
MIVVILAVAILVGGGAFALLWSHGVILALIGSAIAASAAVFATAMLIVSREAPSGSAPSAAASLLAQLLGKRGQR